MARDVPGSVVNSMRVLGLIVATSGVITLLTWLMRDEVILGWAEGNPSAQEILAQGGIEQLRDSPIVPGFVALAVVAFVGFAALALDLGSFFLGGHGTRPDQLQKSGADHQSNAWGTQRISDRTSEQASTRGGE